VVTSLLVTLPKAARNEDYLDVRSAVVTQALDAEKGSEHSSVTAIVGAEFVALRRERTNSWNWASGMGAEKGARHGVDKILAASKMTFTVVLCHGCPCLVGAPCWFNWSAIQANVLPSSRHWTIQPITSCSAATDTRVMPSSAYL